jgi:hypothetical protein
MADELTPQELVNRCQDVLAHAWMVRTFVKHSSEVESFPELMQVVRTVFDVSRSLESRVADPAAYFRQLRKKFRRLREAADQFRHDAPVASDHTNFKQAVISMDACITALDGILQVAPSTDPVRPASHPSVGQSLDDNAPPPDDDET